MKTNQPSHKIAVFLENKIKYYDLLSQLKQMVEDIRDSDGSENKTNNDILISKCREIIKGIENNEIKIRKLC